jgi:hypothetical protein
MTRNFPRGLLYVAHLEPQTLIYISNVNFLSVLVTLGGAGNF